LLEGKLGLVLSTPVLSAYAPVEALDPPIGFVDDEL